jgi:hypothetical protein
LRTYERDPGKVREWREETFPQVLARALPEGPAIFFAAEACAGKDYQAGTTWLRAARSPWSKAPEERARSPWRPRSARAASCISIPPDEGINAEDFIAFCEVLVADAEPSVFLILDARDMEERQSKTALTAPPHRAGILRNSRDPVDGNL